MIHAEQRRCSASQITYSGPKILVKQEPIDLVDTPESVDMSLQVRELHPSITIHNPLNSQQINCQSVPLYGVYGPSSYQKGAHQASQIAFRKRIAQKDNFALINYFTLSSLQPSGINDYQKEECDKKLISQGILATNDNDTVVENEDLSLLDKQQRAKREFVPDSRKDDGYWCKRLKNNDSARRSRVKRKHLEKMMENRLVELQKENIELRHQVAALRKRFGEEAELSNDSTLLQRQESSKSPPLSAGISCLATLGSSINSSEAIHINNYPSAIVMGCTADSSHTLVIPAKVRVASIEDISYSRTSSRTSLNSSFDSSSSISSSFDSGLHPTEANALNLTSNRSNNGTPLSGTSSPVSLYSDGSCSLRRSSFVSSDNNSQEDNANPRNMKSFPLKLRLKREMHFTSTPYRKP